MTNKKTNGSYEKIFLYRQPHGRDCHHADDDGGNGPGTERACRSAVLALRPCRGCKMVEMHDTELKGYSLSVYKSLTYGRRQQNEVNSRLMSDRKHAKKIREVVDDGRIVSGYYMMPPVAAGCNRYILFSNTGDGSGAVIYIEGRLSPDDIMKICYGK